MPKIYAIIPARSGSKGVPFKNVRPLAGYALIAYSIVAARMCSAIGRVIVSTDSQKIAELCKKYGAEAPFLRPAEFAGDLSPDRDFVTHALNWFRENENDIPDYLVHIRPTTPLRDPCVIEGAIAALISRPEATSLRSGHEAPESPFKWFVRDGDGYFRGLNAHGYDPADANLPRQLFPSVYVPNGYVDVLRTSFVLNSEDIHGDRMLGYLTPACTEVDSIEEFEYLEFQITKAGSKVYDFLKANYRED
jgi:CMP-N,N'-diacetyllegionaminic acid synthase